MSHTMMVGAVRSFAAALNEMGLDGDAIARRHVSDELLNDPDGRVGFAAYRAAMAEFVEQGGETIGLRAGALAALGSTLEYLARTSSTWGGALRHVQRYARLAADRIVADLHERPNEVVFEFQIPVEVGFEDVPLSLVRQNVDGLLALIVSLGRSITATEWNPTEVRFSYPRPADTKEMEELFCAPLRFGADFSGLVMEPRLMKLAVVTGDTQLNMILESCCATLLHELPKSDNIHLDVMRRLAKAIPRGEHSIERVARDVGMSVRTLQRRLSEAGHSFNDVVDETRSLLARRYLEQETLSISDATLLLGYSDTRAFQRAFKRWTGRTPADFRAEARD